MFCGGIVSSASFTSKFARQPEQSAMHVEMSRSAAASSASHWKTRLFSDQSCRVSSRAATLLQCGPNLDRLLEVGTCVVRPAQGIPYTERNDFPKRERIYRAGFQDETAQRCCQARDGTSSHETPYLEASYAYSTAQMSGCRLPCRPMFCSVSSQTLMDDCSRSGETRRRGRQNDQLLA